ncbi:MAG TPA: type I glutamate--ammonia ligase [Candidatus Dormibacteraeota bacterium]|nr:type I glutamate--ammonia ligase [Candidatus Dormibacteraeota bacterium]
MAKSKKPAASGTGTRAAGGGGGLGAAISRAKAQGVLVVDVRFTDLLGSLQHFSLPLSEFTADLETEGLGFDGSSIRGFQAINESDMLLLPDASTAYVDPTLHVPTLVVACDIFDPITREAYSRDPRYIATKAEAHLQQSGIADTAYFGPEAEFYTFNSLAFDQNAHSGYYFIDSEEGIWNSGIDGGEPNMAFRPRHKEGYFPVPPVDKLQDFRSELMLKLIEAGLAVEVQHHEVGTAGQAEIDLRFNTLKSMADDMQKYKYIVKNFSASRGYVSTFMPKPLFQDNGSGMHIHQSLWKAGKPLFAGDGYGGLSDLARHYVGGLLKHAPALLAFCAPTTNSYRRLVPGYEAPINLVYSKRNRSACVRIPMYSSNPKAKRIEFRCPDPAANPYLAFSACLMAGLDGIKHKIEPPTPVDADIYELSPREKRRIKNTPGSLKESLDALAADHAFLLEGGVFTADLIETWIDYKQTKEVDAIALRPHPWEFHLYHDV